MRLSKDPEACRELSTLNLGRSIRVKRSRGSVALFHWDELCSNDSALSAADYITIAQNFQTILLTGIPAGIDPIKERDRVRRFITLIDVLYDHGSKIMLQTDSSSPDDIFKRTAPPDLVLGHTEQTASALMVPHEEAFATNRTISRLHQMLNANWWTIRNE